MKPILLSPQAVLEETRISAQHSAYIALYLEAHFYLSDNLSRSLTIFFYIARKAGLFLTFSFLLPVLLWNPIKTELKAVSSGFLDHCHPKQGTEENALDVLFLAAIEKCREHH